MDFAAILALAVKINSLRKSNPAAFKAVSDQFAVFMADWKVAFEDHDLTAAEALDLAAEACLGMERALRLATTIVSTKE